MEPKAKTPQKTGEEREHRINIKKTPITTTPKNIAKYLLLSHNSSTFSSPSLKSIRNPFENQLHDRLHLPMISSPSLFQVSTPTSGGGTSEEFVWSIEDLSNLRPQNIHPHSIQFEEAVDPMVESQAQAAITTFFNENINVPSPQDCWLRKQKIILKEENKSTDIINSTEISIVKNEVSTQTQLSFPPVLPKEIEDLLKTFTIVEDSANDTFGSAKDNSMIDISTLRRKLFINHDESSPELIDDYRAVTVPLLSPPPHSPDMEGQRTKFCDDEDGNIGSANFKNNSSGCDMFGELSPIQKFSPNSSITMDVSMKSNEKTPSRVLGKIKKKNLSESFCMMQNNIEFEENDDFHVYQESKTSNIFQSSTSTKVRFARFDSGFPTDDDISNDMQF